MPTVTVIIPIYKVERYLDACVESVVRQSYADLEILLVDDGSPDRCPALCDAWAEKDPRIKVIHRENGGLSAARNAGLTAADSEYLVFLDADDALRPGALQAALDAHLIRQMRVKGGVVLQIFVAEQLKLIRLQGRDVRVIHHAYPSL